MSDDNQEQNSENKEEKKFSEEYVKQLREEAKANRLKASETESKLQEIQKQLEEINKQKAEEQGKFKELYESQLEKVKQLETETESFKPFKEKFESLENQIREDLLSKLDEKHKAIANDLPIDKLRTYVELNSVNTNYDKTRTGGVNFTTEGKTWTDFTTKELEELRKVNPELVNKLHANYLKNKK